MEKSFVRGQLLVVHKYRGETLAVLVARVRHEYGIAHDIAVTYAGRLDPMAEGLVLLLSGERCKEKEAYTGLDKEYEFTVLFGCATDTYDVLGIAAEAAFSPTVATEGILAAMENVAKRTSWPYPPYSSRTVNGAALFAHARAGTLPTELPVQHGSVKTVALIAVETVKAAEIIDEIRTDIQNVVGDFRQALIQETWEALQTKYANETVTLATFRATVTSGVYIRTIAHELGKELGIPALAYRIVRTRVGEYKI